MSRFSLKIGKSSDVRKWSSERISHVVLYSLTALIALVFLLFYFVGYETPAMWDERYISPLLTDLVMGLMLILLVGTFVVACLSKWHSVHANHTPAVVNVIHGKRITLGVTLGTIALMAVLFALPSSSIYVNGELFEEKLWLRAANMFVVASVLLIIIGIGAILFGVIRNRRK
jgi:magnesium-transporting ATPase (P-type)